MMTRSLLALFLLAASACGVSHEGHLSIEQRGFKRGVDHVKCEGDNKLCHVRHCEKRAGDFFVHCWREWEPCK